MPQDTATQAVPPSTQDDIADLKVIVNLLTKLVNDANSPEPSPTAATTTDLVEARDTNFRYRLLTALMSAGSLSGLVITVTRDRGGLAVARPDGVEPGTSLSLVAKGKPFEFTLSGDRVLASALKEAGVDVAGQLDAFVLRSGPGGHIVAVAPALAAIAGSPTAS